MLKLNSKKVILKVQKHIWECAIDYAVECDDVKAPVDFKEAAILLADTFKSEYGIKAINNELKSGMTYFEIFAKWGQGLPFSGLFDFNYNVSPVDLLGGWLEQTDVEKAKYTADQAREKLNSLIYREMSKIKNIWEA